MNLAILADPHQSKSFGRIATQNIFQEPESLQKIREEGESRVYDQYFEKRKDIVTGIGWPLCLARISCQILAERMPSENEQVKGENYSTYRTYPNYT